MNLGYKGDNKFKGYDGLKFLKDRVRHFRYTLPLLMGMQSVNRRWMLLNPESAPDKAVSWIRQGKKHENSADFLNSLNRNELHSPYIKYINKNREENYLESKKIN